ncbi:MAG: DOMON domain-containing protein [Candidatus Kariarchaeaceae archaeon]|jgi:hypothetical protein
MRETKRLEIPSFTQYSKIILILLLSSVSISSTRASISQGIEIIMDGVITTGEYTHNQIVSDGDYILYWRNIGNEIYFGIEGKTNGWVALGFNPTFMMLGADMYFGWVNGNGSVEMVDAYATGPTGPHPPDIDLGGSNNILNYNGTESGQITSLEFKRLLTTSDTSYDNPIPASGSIKVIWAMGASDSFDAPHVKRGSIQWGLATASSFNADFSQPLILAISLILSLSGLLIFVDSKGRPKNKENEGKGD